MILVIDNYDSFTYNLVQYLGELGADPKVYRNDKITVDQIKKLKPEKFTKAKLSVLWTSARSWKSCLAKTDWSTFPSWLTTESTK